MRLHGCGLRCVWCDTDYALDHSVGGEWKRESVVLENIRAYQCSFIEFTGGEPLEQEGCIPFMTLLCDEGFTVAVETGGHIDISNIDPRVIKIVDLKCPGSGMMKKNNRENIHHLMKHDEVKFVIADENDYLWSVDTMRKHDLASRCDEVLFSPVFGSMSAEQLASWILRDHLPVRMQMQVHKFIWDARTRGV